MRADDLVYQAIEKFDAIHRLTKDVQRVARELQKTSKGTD